jgi:hypothetical protein
VDLADPSPDKHYVPQWYQIADLTGVVGRNRSG